MNPEDKQAWPLLAIVIGGFLIGLGLLLFLIATDV